MSLDKCLHDMNGRWAIADHTRSSEPSGGEHGLKTEDQTDRTRRSAARGLDRRGEAAGEDVPDRLVRLSVNLGPEVADQLKEYASRKGVSVTEAVRRAIAVLAFVDEAQNRGASLNLEEGGALKEILFLV
jgi:hypothetical protein